MAKVETMFTFRRAYGTQNCKLSSEVTLIFLSFLTHQTPKLPAYKNS